MRACRLPLSGSCDAVLLLLIELRRGRAQRACLQCKGASRLALHKARRLPAFIAPETGMKSMPPGVWYFF